MMNEDTVKLLKECNAGSKTAVCSLKEVVDRIQDEQLKQIIQKSIEEHEKFGGETHELLHKTHDTDKEPNPIAKAMSWTKINMKLMPEATDKEIADLMTDGCNMGIKSLFRYKNQYQTAGKEAVDCADKLIASEEQLLRDLRAYL